MHGAKELIYQLKDHAVAAFWSLSAAIFLFAIAPVFFVQGPTVRWVLAVTTVLVSLGILVWAQAPIRRIGTSLQEAVRQIEADGEKCRQQILNLEETCGRMEREKKDAEEEWKTKTREYLGRVAEEQARTASSVHLRLENERLVAEHKRLDQELSESSTRRRLSESRNLDLEQRLGEMDNANASSSAKLKESEQEILRLRENAHALRTQNESLRQNSVKLQRELEVVTLARSNLELRLSQMEQELNSLRSRAEGAEETVRYLQSDRPAQEALAARREVEQLLQAEQAVKRELESEKCALESRISRLEQEAGRAEQLIKELHECCRERAAESKPQLADHFVWNVNYFHDHEVILNFVNRGVVMDLIEAICQPAIAADLPVGRHLGRNEEGRIRFSSKAILPQEFLVRIRVTAFAQEAAFRIRPFADNKIERI